MYLLPILVILVSQTAGAGEEVKKSSPDANQPIKITADKMVADQEASFVKFSGNVEAVQGQTTITADKLTVLYQKSPREKGPVNQDRIKQITATGNVGIRMADKQAHCEQAVYLAPSRTIILTGENTRLQIQGNMITGEKITIHQDTGQIIVEGGKSRVSAIFQPEPAASAH